MNRPSSPHSRCRGCEVRDRPRGPDEVLHPRRPRLRRRPARAASRDASDAAARAAARAPGPPRRRASGPTSSPRPRRCARADWTVAPLPGRPARPPRRDHRPGRPQDDHQRAQLGRERLHGRLRGLALARPGRNLVDGQLNLRDAVRRHDRLRRARDRQALPRSTEQTATLIVRPRGWHLPEKHVLRRRPARSPASLFDFGLFFFHNAQRAARPRHRALLLPAEAARATSRRGCGTTSSSRAQDALGLPRGTIQATVLIETLLAAFEMDEILYELREHSAGLNCGRWDYIFSFIKTFRRRPGVRAARPRARSTMDAALPARLHASCSIQTCHRRGAHAMGGMAAQIPIKDDPAANDARAREGARRQAARGRATATTAPGSRTRASSPSRARSSTRSMPGPNQLDRARDDVHVTAARPARGARPARDHRGRPAPQHRASACSTSRPGCAASAACRSTT